MSDTQETEAPASKPTTTREVLIRAKEILKTRGRTRGTFENEAGQVCAAGAAKVALGHRGADYFLGDEYDTYSDVCRALCDQVPRLDHSLVYYNDLPDTTDEDIFELYDRAIAACSE